MGVRDVDRTQIWVATVSQDGASASSAEQMVTRMLERMETFLPYAPDIVCLPEAFPFVNLNGGRPASHEVAEIPPGPTTEPLVTFAKEHACYVICPTYTREGDRCFNAAVLIDRDGSIVGEYRKAHLTEGELDGGLTPGPLAPPVFDTDFGRIGIQICFDIEWLDGWQGLRNQGAEMVFWPSAFGGGRALNAYAERFHYAVVSSTRKDTSKIVGLDGLDMAASGRFDRAGVCAPVNLEQAFLHTWPYNREFAAIRAKYGRDILIRTLHEEEWTIVESRNPDIRIKDVLAEYHVPTHDELTRGLEPRQDEARASPSSIPT